MKREDWGFKIKMDVYLSEYNTDDVYNPKERAKLYDWHYSKKGGDGRTEPFKHEIIIRQKSKIVFRQDLSDVFDEALIQFHRIVRKRAEPIHPFAKMIMNEFGNGYLEIPKEKETTE